jgi:hypothetical protein
VLGSNLGRDTDNVIFVQSFQANVKFLFHFVIDLSPYHRPYVVQLLTKLLSSPRIWNADTQTARWSHKPTFFPWDRKKGANNWDLNLGCYELQIKLHFNLFHFAKLRSDFSEIWCKVCRVAVGAVLPTQTRVSTTRVCQVGRCDGRWTWPDRAPQNSSAAPKRQSQFPFRCHPAERPINLLRFFLVLSENR